MMEIYSSHTNAAAFTRLKKRTDSTKQQIKTASNVFSIP